MLSPFIELSRWVVIFFFPITFRLSLYFFHSLPFQRPLTLTPTVRSGCGLYSLVIILKYKIDFCLSVVAQPDKNEVLSFAPRANHHCTCVFYNKDAEKFNLQNCLGDFDT